LLDLPDPELAAYLLRGEPATDPELAALVAAIRRLPADG
jgi:succinate dehydrogenase flavin-adding protein (antitoxin of CptAB toxin-antitoxin module)